MADNNQMPNLPQFGHITETPNRGKRKGYNPGEESDKRRRTVDEGYLRRNQPAPLDFGDAYDAAALAAPAQPAVGNPAQGAPVHRGRDIRGPDMNLLARSDCPFTGNSPPPVNPAASTLRICIPTELTLAKNTSILFRWQECKHRHQRQQCRQARGCHSLDVEPLHRTTTLPKHHETR